MGGALVEWDILIYFQYVDLVPSLDIVLHALCCVLCVDEIVAHKLLLFGLSALFC